MNAFTHNQKGSTGSLVSCDFVISYPISVIRKIIHKT